MDSAVRAGTELGVPLSWLKTIEDIQAAARRLRLNLSATPNTDTCSESFLSGIP